MIKNILKKCKFFLTKIYNLFYIINIFSKNKDSILVWIYPHIGDMFYALPYTNILSIDKKITIIGNEKYIKYYRMFNNIANYILLSEKNCFKFTRNNNLKITIRYMQKKIMNKKFYSNDFDLVKTIYPVNDSEDLISYTKRCIYQMDNPKIKYPTLSKPITLCEKKYVILSPYAQSARIIPGSAYDKLIEELHKMDIVVYTNVGKNQSELKNTIKLDCTLENLSGYVKNAIAFIGIRSGICDLLAATTQTPLFIFFNNYPLKGFASTKKYRDIENIYEQYDDNFDIFLDKVINEIRHLKEMA